MSEPIRPNNEREVPIEYFGSGTAGVLFKDFWFRLAAGVLLIGVLLIALLLPKIWRTTPDGFTPEVKISWLDRLQARSLRMTAERMARNGRMQEALGAWRSALANDPGNPDLARGSLLLLVDRAETSDQELGRAYGTATWLLQLTGTNVADLQLVLQVFDRYGLDDQIRHFGREHADRLTPPSDAVYLRALYNGGDYEGFARYWEAHEAGFSGQAELAVYRAAWAAAFGPAAGAREGREALLAAAENSGTRITAHRLLLGVRASMLDPDGYARSLEILVDSRADRPRDHAAYWRLLLQAGQREEAARLARGYANPPATPAEAVAMALIFAELGTGSFAADFLQKHQAALAFTPEYWVTHARLLIAEKRWMDIRGLALGLRNTPGIGGTLDGYSFFLEGLAESKMERIEAARDAMARVTSGLFGNPQLARLTAAEMRNEGYPVPALELLRMQEDSFKEDASYWFEVTATAFLAQDNDTLIAAAKKTYELDPEKAAHVNNYAAALLVTRTQPDEAIQLTLKLLAIAPSNVDYQLNHILALLQNNRLDQAEEQLRQFIPIDLTRLENAVFQSAWFELHWRRGRIPLARSTYDRIERRLLVPESARWLESTYRSLPLE